MEKGNKTRESDVIDCPRLTVSVNVEWVSKIHTLSVYLFTHLLC